MKLKTIAQNNTVSRTSTIVKYLFPVVLSLFACSTAKDTGYIFYTVSDVFIIFCLTNLLLPKSRHFYWLNSILLLLVNIELGVLYYSGSIVTLTMLQNINSARVLKGHAVAYIGTIVIGVIFSFLPVRAMSFKKEYRKMLLLALSLAFQLILGIVLKENYSVWNSLYSIYEQQRDLWELSAAIGTTKSESTELPEISEKPEDSPESKTTAAPKATSAPTPAAAPKVTSTPVPTATPRPTASPTPTPLVIKDEELYKSEVTDSYKKPAELSDTPNVILIFTEGLSQNIVEDERGIMPNVAQMQSESINFTNYFNHTFATYRAIQGQLYSGYQLYDSDENNLISIQEILKKNGYYTAMINTEPRNKTFSAYLKQMGFDAVLSDSLENLETGSTQSDESSYELLLNTAMNLEKEDTPFFLAIYTIGTHASFDSTDEIFGDGSSNVLNRFYNADYQFGNFFQKFKNSELAEDTILVFTADHATYAEADFIEAFPDYVRTCLDVDEIPLSIYYEGAEPRTIDAGGRNSLDLAPTLLDFLDISDSNYFLGESLFGERSAELSCDTVFFDPTFWKNTGGGVIADLDDSQKEEMISRLQHYFAVMAMN